MDWRGLGEEAGLVKGHAVGGKAFCTNGAWQTKEEARP